VGDVEDPHRGRDVEDHGVADADELVGAAVIRQERDERRSIRRRDSQNPRREMAPGCTRIV
jgi:hypothetical protein